MSVSPNLKSLYETLGVEEFASTFKVNEAIDKLRSTDQLNDKRTQLAIEILTDHELKEAYNMLLESRNSGNNQLPHIQDETFLTTVLDLAKRTGFNVQQQQHGSLIVGADPIQLDQTIDEGGATEPPSPDVDDFTVGRMPIKLLATPFVVTPAFLNSATQIRYVDTQGNPKVVRSNGQNLLNSTEPGDRGLIVLAGLDQDEPSFEAALINQFQNIVVPLSAGDAWFNQSSVEIAYQFRIRNTPARISKIIREYYRELAEFLPRFDNNVRAQTAKSTFLKYAKLQHRI